MEGSKKTRPSGKGERAVVSVAFARDDLNRVAGAAKREGVNTSEFIRRSTLGGVARQRNQGTVWGISGLQGIAEDVTMAVRGQLRQPPGDETF